MAAAFATAVALVAVAGPASADPSEFRMIAMPGSDTTQDVLNGLGTAIVDTNDVDGDGDTAEKVIGSYDARGTSTVTTKDASARPNCTGIARPNGSTAGRNALRDALVPGNQIQGCWDASRSSSRPSSPVVNGTATYIPFGVDAVTFSINENSDLPTNMRVAQLQGIYTCVIEDIVGTPVQPLLIQSGSGTRQYWNTVMGINDTEINAGDYPCLIPPTHPAGNGTGLAEVQEHDGRELTRTPARLDLIMPMSIAQFIAQGNNLPGVQDRRGDALLGSVNGVAPTANGLLNTAFPFTRDVYNIVPTAKLADPVLSGTFVGTGSYVCGQNSVINNYGFGTAANCGSTTLQGNF